MHNNIKVSCCRDRKSCYKVVQQKLPENLQKIHQNDFKNTSKFTLFYVTISKILNLDETFEQINIEMSNKFFLHVLKQFHFHTHFFPNVINFLISGKSWQHCNEKIRKFRSTSSSLLSHSKAEQQNTLS